MLPRRRHGNRSLLQCVKGGYPTNPDAIYPNIREDVYWQRDVKQVYIFSEKTGESLAGNVTAGRIIELSDGTRSVREIADTLMKEFSENPDQEEMVSFVTQFLSECEQKEFIELLQTPVQRKSEPSVLYTPADVDALIEGNAVVLIDEKASFEPTEDEKLMTYSLKEGRYFFLTDQEKEILLVLLEEKPLQEVFSEVEESLKDETRSLMTAFVSDLLNHQLARVQKD
ncbi:MAG: PqqD family peptide modification chaperone [Candidatus Methanofastidiosia archaeon]